MERRVLSRYRMALIYVHYTLDSKPYTINPISYPQEYLAIGEAPDQVRNCYQQRSRWCKGHFQIFFNRSHCPALQPKLSVSPT